MDFVNIKCDDMYEIRCGEIYLNLNGTMDIHCSLCEKIFQDFKEYALHVERKHSQFENLQPNSKYFNKEDAFMVVLDDDSSSEFSTTDDEEMDEHINETLDEYISPLTQTEIESNDFTDVEPAVFQNIVMDNEKDLEIKPYEEYFSHNKKSDEIKKYKCPHCKYTGKDKYNFKAHVKRHFEIFKRYKCTYCPMSFHSSCDVKRHIQTHTGEKPFLCQECGKAWSNKHKLEAHLKRHRNLRDFHCNQCDKSFFSKLLLKEHIGSVHTEERRFVCDICHVASFKTKKGLMVHKKIHANKLQYQCPHCPARFNQNPGLHSHIKSKHPI